ncbi:UPF0175 family protein [Thiofilum flexile]|uniref:UPF0175 family protein n=1 Tax=Thiofilum flexile TaxID=125627 RepID=UPI000361BF07|nr:UPF0175 family protein [Thiofilum flexile]
MQIAIELPNDFTQLRGIEKIIKEIHLSYALRLYKSDEVTLSKAAELAGLDLYDFMSACKQEGIPTISISQEELLEDLNGFNSYRFGAGT